jgi:hypothetical protein
VERGVPTPGYEELSTYIIPPQLKKGGKAPKVPLFLHENPVTKREKLIYVGIAR